MKYGIYLYWGVPDYILWQFITICSTTPNNPDELKKGDVLLAGDLERSSLSMIAGHLLATAQLLFHLMHRLVDRIVHVG